MTLRIITKEQKGTYDKRSSVIMHKGRYLNDKNRCL